MQLPRSRRNMQSHLCRKMEIWASAIQWQGRSSCWRDLILRLYCQHMQFFSKDELTNQELKHQSWSYLRGQQCPHILKEASYHVLYVSGQKTFNRLWRFQSQNSLGGPTSNPNLYKQPLHVNVQEIKMRDKVSGPEPSVFCSELTSPQVHSLCGEKKKQNTLTEISLFDLFAFAYK